MSTIDLSKHGVLTEGRKYAVAWKDGDREHFVAGLKFIDADDTWFVFVARDGHKLVLRAESVTRIEEDKRGRL